MNPEIQELVQQYPWRWAAFFQQDDISGESQWNAEYLKLMFDQDQGYRNQYGIFLDSGATEALEELGPLLAAVDDDNQARLKALLETMGWPHLSIHGQETCRHAWMIVLHSDRDVAFQREVVALMEPLLNGAEVEPVSFAALSDRIAIHEDRPQRWGMFYRLVNGEKEFLPIDDPENLAERRAELGLDDTTFRYG